jgi:hypothetical protein
MLSHCITLFTWKVTTASQIQIILAGKGEDLVTFWLRCITVSNNCKTQVRKPAARLKFLSSWKYLRLYVIPSSAATYCRGPHLALPSHRLLRLAQTLRRLNFFFILHKKLIVFFNRAWLGQNSISIKTTFTKLTINFVDLIYHLRYLITKSLPLNHLVVYCLTNRD